jgi:peptide/nickel transport system ATP-binding protein
VTTQAQILKLFVTLQSERRPATILITHDLAVVAETAERVAVMYAGRIVEEAPVLALFEQPLHPYTRGLIASIAPLDQAGGRRRLTEIPGTVPPLWHLPPGCAFAPRCPGVTEECRRRRPPLREVAPGRKLACFHEPQGEVPA